MEVEGGMDVKITKRLLGTMAMFAIFIVRHLICKDICH